MDALRARASMLREIREFFDTRGLLEVETPALSRAAATDVHIDSFAVTSGNGAAPTLYLHTSPEFPMKRLLAAGSGPIYQVSRVFRDGERGRLHNPEFTLLEWYRPGFDHHALMEEVEALVCHLLDPFVRLGPTRRLSYAQAFRRYADVDPHSATTQALKACAAEHGIVMGGSRDDMPRDGWLDLLLTQVVEPHLGGEGLCFVYDYPASQAALARVGSQTPPLAARFELYVRGMELANGFHELTDSGEQRRRFEADRTLRQAHGRSAPPMDERLLAALAHGLPDCAGVALGLDRLLMTALGAESIDQVLAFAIDKA
jgi:lysyl-tRNA synthetase class 2